MRKAGMILLTTGAVALSSVGCSDKGTDATVPQPDEYYVYALGFSVGSGVGASYVYKIDAQTDSIVDSLPAPRESWGVQASSDGKMLWLMSSSNAVVYNGWALDEPPRTVEIPVGLPFFDYLGNYLVVAEIGGEGKVHFLDPLSLTELIQETLTSPTHFWEDVFHIPEETLLVVIGRTLWELSGQNVLVDAAFFYNYVRRVVVDSVYFHDDHGSPEGADFWYQSPNSDHLLAFNPRLSGGYWFRVFQRRTGRLLRSEIVPVYGPIVPVNEGTQYIRLTGGDCIRSFPEPRLHVYDAEKSAWLLAISLANLELAGRPAANYYPKQAVQIPGTSKIYVGCDISQCNTGGILMLSADGMDIVRNFHLRSDLTFWGGPSGNMALVKKQR